ncbi:MAG: rod shape-determining protein MreD [Nocardioides sp.]|uniref:rod shape-determining protein MreD n=1 Tax=Nocardioides sp. TaxID=35761 RepID=UPI0039E4B06E
MNRPALSRPAPIDLRRLAPPVRRVLPWALAALLVSLALVLQVSLFGAFAWHGVVPDLVLLVVVAAALVRGSEFGIVLGFASGLLLDLAPPADHLAGRWALALLVVGYVAGRVREVTDEQGATLRLPTALASGVACSAVGGSVFALTGLVLRDPAMAMDGLVEPLVASVVWDVLLTAAVVPPVMLAFRRLDRVSRLGGAAG